MTAPAVIAANALILLLALAYLWPAVQMAGLARWGYLLAFLLLGVAGCALLPGCPS
jgi:hypothetical protein